MRYTHDMIKQLSVLGVVPARGGSVRLPGKNIKKLAGVPLIEYTFRATRDSKYLDRVIVVTDDDAIGMFAQEHDVDWPFREPEDLADGTKSDFDFFEYTLRWLQDNEGYRPDIIVQLRPTSPLRTAAQIDAAIELLVKNPEADSVRTVTEPEQSPYKMYGINSEGYLEPLLSVPGETESFNLPQQKLPKTYKHVGYVDVMWRRTIMEKGIMTGSHIIPLVLDGAISGINTPDDWELYEYLIRKKEDGSKK